MISPIQFPWNKLLRQAALRYSLAVFCLILGTLESRAELGLAREAFGVWDREGGHAADDYPYTRGQSISGDGMNWGDVHPSRYNYNWAAIDTGLQIADANNQLSTMSISPVGGLGLGQSHPLWMSATVPFFGETYNPNTPAITPSTYTYGYYLDANFQTYFKEMVEAFAHHVRQQVAANLQARVGFVRVNTGATGDEEPYENGSLVPVQYQISPTQWREYRLWVFELHRKAFQEGPGPVIPLLFSGVEPVPGGANVEWNWILANVKGGFGIKHGGQLRGHHLSESESNVTVYKPLAVDSDFKFFSRNEMDQTWTKPYFRLNVPLNMYWAALEQLNVGMSVWDWSGTCLENADGTLKQFFDNGNFVFSGEFFNKWAAELDPATAGGGFCVFHEGLDSFDTQKFPTGSGPGQYGNASWGNTARYTAICAAYAAQGAQMDDLNGATMGSVAQRDDTPGMIGFNDAGWKIHAGNYDRFITQLDPDNTSKALWRVGGPLTTTSHAYDRFARRSDTASGKNTMYFDINDNLLPSIGQRVQINVTYRNDTAGQFLIKYDAVDNSLKTLTVNKTGLGTGNTVWATASFEVTDWVFGNRQPTSTAPSGSDLQLVNVGPGDTIYHGIELIKMADISVGIIGSGAVTGRNNTAVFSPLPTSVMEAQRLELKVTPAPGWQFTGWSGALTGSNPTPFLFPTRDTRLTATFALASLASSMDDFNSATWSGGTGWSGDWTTAGATKAGAIAELNGGSPTARITRTLNTPLTGATLSFEWDLDRIATNLSESGTVEVFNTVTNSWQTVWSQNSKGGDVDGTANMLPSGPISLTGTITQIRFTLNANGAGDTFLIDNLAISGTPVIAPSSAPQFSSDPISKAAAIVAQSYLGQTLAGSATDPNSNPLTFSKISKLSGGSDWLTISPSGGLSGTPAATDAGLNRWTVHVSSTGGSETAILLINVFAPGPNPPSALTYPSLPVYTKGTAITNVIPTSSGGSVLRYVASPRLPKGLYLNSTTGSISGTPSEVSATATYTITATNTDGATTANIVITVNDIVPSTLSYSSNPANYTTGTAITANTPSNSGGVVISYAVSPTLPAGLALSTSTGIISGTPSAASPTTLYTVTATNTGGSTTAQVSIAVDSLGPVSLAYSSNPAIYTKDVAIANNTPSNSGGAVVSYSVSPALPAGLTLNTANGIINGTPTAITPSANYIVMATNANGSTTASLTITVNDAPPSAMTYSNNPAVYTVGTALTNTTRSTPTNSGGAVVSYSITPALPAGLSLNPTTTSTTFGATRGTPTAASPTTVYTVTATNTGGSTTATLTITVNEVATSAPTNLTYSSNPATYTIGTVITNNTPTSSGGAVASYAVLPALPAGLTLDTTTGVISGTPTAISATATYTVTATNSFGSTSASVSITVNGIAPSALIYSSNPATYNKNTAITNNTPTSGGGAVASYAVTPTLPAGLTLNTSTGVISGTPTAVVPTATYTVTATNSFGSTTASVSITVSDTILTYSNSSLITIRDNNTALPYPSTITVPTTAGTIAKVTVQLNGFNHTYPGDVAMLLVGPSGQKFLLMYHKGAGTDAVNANLGFADSASATLPSAIVSGTYKPSAYSSGTYTFPSPAPAYPYLSGALSSFNGTNPTGTWSLYVRDDANGDSGTLSGGWSLTFEITPPTVAAPSALSYSSNPATYAKGTAIANNTPASSGGAVVSYAVSPALPAGLALNTSTGVISGTPTAVTSIANYTVTATNTSGSTTASLSITVNDAAPSALIYSTNPATYLKDSAIPSNTPTNGGGPVILYSVSPALPTGLALDANTGVISGTPTAATSAANYTVTASNSGGSTTALVSITVYDAVTTLATSGTWTCPSGVTSIQVECWGGGGAGGLASRNGQTSNTACGGGGAGGAYAKLNSYPVTPGVTYFVNVGAGGVSASTDTTKVPGGDSWFNSVNSPSATILAKGGAGGETVLLQSAGNRYGTGGTGTANGNVGDVVNAGGGGVMTTQNAYGGAGGGSGGSGNTSGDNPGMTPATNLGLGAVAVTSGIGGNGGNGGISGSGSGLSPTSSPGGGGGGARCGSASTFSGGTGAAGQVVLTVINNTTPGTPTSVSATPGNAQATVSFSAPASNGGSAITGYTVTSIPAGGTDINAGTTALSHTVTGLTNGTAYTFTVTATNSVGTGTASSASSPVTPATVSIVTTPTSASITGTSATLGGNVTNDGGATVTERGVVFAPSTTNGNPQIGGAGVITLPGTGTTGVFTVSASSLTPGTSYTFAVYATNSQGTSYTTTDTFTTLSNDASLSALEISAGSLSPSFANGTITYTASVSNTTTSTTLTPTVTQANATVTVNGATVTSGSASDSIALSPGSNTIATVVTAQDGLTTQTYTITVNVAVAVPSGLTYTSNPATYTTGTAIANNTPTSSGGAVDSYSVSPALPAGLTLSPTTGVISGMPTAVTATAGYTVMAINTGGFTTAVLNIAVVSPYTAWSTQYNLLQGSEGDDDGDGNSNYFEFVAGLVPTDASSVFKTAASSVPGQLNQLKIVISPIIGGRTYTVKSSTALNPANWIPLSNPTVSDDGNERIVIDTAATEERKFYRIEINMP